MSTDEEITRLFRVRRTVMHMLRDKEYIVDDQDSKPNSTTTTSKEQISSSTRTKKVKYYTKKLKADKVFGGILVVQQNLSPLAKSYLKEISSELRVEIFHKEELLANITEHVLVPMHQVLTDEENKGLLEKYRLQETQLPGMQVTDPIARYYGMKRGQVVMIMRPSETAGQYGCETNTTYASFLCVI